MKIKLMEPIEGYEDVFEAKAVTREDVGRVQLDYKNKKCRVILMEDIGYFLVVGDRKKQWRPATVQDVVDYYNGDKFAARYRDVVEDIWLESTGVAGIVDFEYRQVFFSPSGNLWGICEVLR